mgnify:FL=1
MKSSTVILFNSFLIFFLIAYLSIAIGKSKKDLSSFQWQKRILIFNSVNNQKGSRERNKKIEAWIKINWCQIEERNLIIVNFDEGLNSIYEIPPSVSKKKGVWLIGYDGFIKDYSENLDLLERVMRIIDRMPMRLNEIENKISTCKKVQGFE